MQPRLIVLACFFVPIAIGSVSCFAQQYPFINYTPNDGLVNNRVRSMYQDSKGRLYFLTFGGLSVYDGARFLNYGPAEGLASDIVNDVLEITPDSLWVATNTNQVNCLVKGKIKSLKTSDGFYPVINSFFKSRNGTIYIAADDGLFIWQDQRFRRLSFFDKGKEPVKYIVQIQEVGDLLLILINPIENAGALFLYDPAQQKILYVEKKFITYSTTISPEGNMWLSTDKGVRVLKKELLQKGIFKDEDVPQSFAPVQNKKGSFIKFDNLGQLWLSIYNEDLLLIKPGAAPVLYNETNGLGSTLISYIFQDKEGDDWFLPEGKGAQKLVSNNIEFVDHPFKKAFINDLYAQTQSDSVWLYDGIMGQLILLSGSTKKTFLLPPLKNGHLLAKGSLIWLYNDKNIFRVTVPAAGSQCVVTLIYKDSSLQAGYGVIDSYSNLIYCADNQLKIFQKNKIASSYPLDYFAEQLSFDQSGHLWIATRSNKLQVFTLHPENPAHYLHLQYDLSSQMHLQNPRSLVVDDSNNIWIGTRFDGLYCFRFSKNRLNLLQHFTRKEGLTDNFINYLSCDRNNNIWASSLAGLDRLETDHPESIISNITESNHLFVSIKKVMTDKSGTTWALGESGNLLKVYAQKKYNSLFTPLLYISQIKSGSALYSDADSIHSFSYRQNNLNFSIAVPSFYDEKQIKYSYVLNGSSNKLWSKPSGNADFNFVNLAPGRYTLKIRADFPAGRYKKEFLSYSFAINPPWWQTWWFRFLFAAIAITVIIYIIRFYYNRKLEKQRVISEKQRAIEKERTRIAIDMHDDLGAGLSTIRFLSEKVKRNTFSDVTKNDAGKIVINSDELVQKMNEIIWAMNEKNDTLEDLLYYTRSYAAEYCEENNLQCETHLPENIPSVIVSGEIRRNIFLTVKESLHNSVKHAAANKIKIDFNIAKSLIITIEDDGKGLVNKSNEGNGLRNMQKRIETIGGNFKIFSSSGVTVQIEVPLAV